ncbi:MAG: FAD-binding oxidoreductase [Myxococcales bacterium]|nr:FAD-binding oxidoreductase [Myxococcales bacterium]
MQRAEVCVVGGGIAGLAVAWALARRGEGDVRLFEREPLLATHASGRNAAIFRQLDADPVGLALGAATARGLETLPTKAPALRRTGALYLSPVPVLEALAATLAAHGVRHELVPRAALAGRSALLDGTDADGGLMLPDDGVLDIDALATALAEGARAGGARLELGRGVRAICVGAGRVQGVELDDGTRVASPSVVLAAGAWSAALAAAAGVPLPLVALRRHLAQLEPERPVAPGGPVVWRLGEGETYLRPESGGLLASPCDEEPWVPGVPPAEPAIPPTAPEALERLALLLAPTTPGVASARVRRLWACLRTFAPDRGFVLGPDPRLTGLHWVAGLGGRGMSCCLGLGELGAALVLGEEHALAAAVAPGRLLGG